MKILMILLLTTLSQSYKIIKPQCYLNYNKIRPIFSDLYNIDSSDKNYNLEHIVPQSPFNKNSTIRRDMHNIILYPSQLNLHRSNYRFSPNPNIFPNSKLLNSDGKIIDYIGPIDSTVSIKTNKLKNFHPADKYKGIIARSIMYFLMTYPNYEEKIFKDIIDPYTILNWHLQFPVDKFEEIKNLKIESYQKNRNIYIIEPKQLIYDMENLIKEDLNVFYNYKFKKID